MTSMLPSNLTGDTPGAALDRMNATPRANYRGHDIGAVWHGQAGYRTHAGIVVYGGFSWAAAPGATWTHTAAKAKALIDLWEEVRAEGPDKGALRFWARNAERAHNTSATRIWLLDRLFEATLLMRQVVAGSTEARRLARATEFILNSIVADDKMHKPLGEAEACIAKQLAGGQPTLWISTDGEIDHAASGLTVVDGRFVAKRGFVETTA